MVRATAAPFSEQLASGAGLDAQAAEGDVIDMSGLLREFPMRMTTLEEFGRNAILG